MNDLFSCHVPYVYTTPTMWPLMEGHLRKQSYVRLIHAFSKYPHLLVTEKPLKFKKSSEAVNKVMSTGFIQITTLFTTTIWKLLYEIPTFMINYGVILNIYFYWVFEISVMRNLQFVKRYLKARESTIKHVQNQNWSSFFHLSVDSSRVQEYWNDATSINHLESSDFTKVLQVTALSPQRTNIFYPF